MLIEHFEVKGFLFKICNGFRFPDIGVTWPAGLGNHHLFPPTMIHAVFDVPLDGNARAISRGGVCFKEAKTMKADKINLFEDFWRVILGLVAWEAQIG